MLKVQPNKWLRNMPIKLKLLIFVISFSVLMFGIGIISVLSIKQINENSNDMYEVNMLANEYLGQLIESNVRLQKYEVEYVLSDYNIDGTEVEGKIDEVINEAATIFENLKKIATSEEITQKFPFYEEYIAEANSEREKVTQRLKSGSRLEAYMYYQNKLNKVREDTIILLNEMKQLSLVQSSAFNEQNQEHGRNVLLTVVIAILTVLIIGSLFIIHIYRQIHHSLKQLASSMKEVEKGNLQIITNDLGENEFGQLSKSFNKMVESLRLIVKQMKKNSQKVASSTTELLESSQHLLSFSESIAREIKDIASQAETQVLHMNESTRALEEVAGGVQRINESAVEVAEVSNTANEQALVGSESMKSVREQMNQILQGSTETATAIHQFSETSTEINKFVSYIEELSNQVNLLSLNASIEAARAGEHGKGFAVVANEVKNLAEHTKNAAASISKMVKAIQTQANSAVAIVEKEQLEVARGLKEAETAQTIFENIANSIQNIHAQLQEVTAATEEMSASAEEVTGSLHEVASLSNIAYQKANQVSEAAKQQQYIMGDSKNNVSDLSKIAEVLEDEANKFNIAK